MAYLEGGCAVTGPTQVSELEFGECCFCESRGEHRNMMSKPVSEGDQENYFEMLLECFNVYVATGSMGRSLICTSCASRLRDARDFKQLVLRAHARLRGAATSMAVEVSRPVSNVKIKLEPEEPPGETAEPDSDYCGVVVKSEPDMEIVEHGLMRRTDLKSGFREDNGTTDKMLGDGQTEPKKQRLGKQETTKMDTTLAGMLSCPQEPMELKTENEITTLNMMDPCAHIPSTSSTPMETEDALPSTSAIPTTAEKNALRNREYRKRVAATRTPEQAAAFARKAAERQRKAYHLRRAANLALASGTVETTRIVQTSAQRKRASRQRQAERVRSAAQPSTSSNQAAVHQEQPTWSTKWSSSIHRFKSTFLDNDFG